MTKTIHKTKKKLFNKYSKINKEYLTKKEIVKLMKREYHLNYTQTIINSFMSIWGTKIKNKQVITLKTFPKLFQKPDGFFRNQTK